MSSVWTFVAMAAVVAGLATHAAAQQQCGPCGSDWVAYELQDKIQLNTPITVTSPFTTGSVLMTKTHRLLVPAGLDGSGPASPEPHYLGVALIGVDYACVDVTLDGSIPVENWMVCFNQKTKPQLFPPDVWLTTQDLGSFPDIRMDPLDEVCVQAQVQ